MRRFELLCGNITKCPKCRNNNKFKAHSSQVEEDICEVWVECDKCGFDPTAEHITYRFEDTFGGTNDRNCIIALDCWNDAIKEFYNIISN